MAEQPPAYRPTTSGTRVYLDVPYSEKEAAKALGARWDQAAKRWYDPRPPTTGLDPWAARPPVPDLLPGEDRAFGAGLFVDMVPRSCWFTNVRSCVTPQDWERLRRMITRRAGQKCEACWAGEDRTVQRWLEAHERWAYDDRTGVQALRRLICLCSDCHLSTHLGLANVTGRADQALAHLRAVTGMTDSEVSRHVQAAGELWTRRSARVWTLDLTMLTDAGVTLARPETAADRAAAAERELRDLRGTTARVIPAPRTPPEQPQHRPTSRTEPPNRAGPDLAALLADSGWLNGPDDLARNAPGIGVSYEAARRLHTEGVGADHSWRVGADGEITVAAVLSTLTTPSRLNRLRRRSPAWKVLHSVPVGTGRGDIDHVLIGPPGVFTINTKHHRAGRLALDGDELIVNGRATDYIPTARREALRAAALLGSALDATGHPELAARLTMRPVLAIVGGRVLITTWAGRLGGDDTPAHPHPDLHAARRSTRTRQTRSTASPGIAQSGHAACRDRDSDAPDRAVGDRRYLAQVGGRGIIRTALSTESAHMRSSPSVPVTTSAVPFGSPRINAYAPASTESWPTTPPPGTSRTSALASVHS